MTKKLFLTLTITALFFTNCATRQASVAEALTVVEALETTATHDYGVVINGIRWATRNVDAPGTFAPTPESSGMFFQWNRKKGWNAIDEVVEGWDSSTPTGTEWYAENDPCPEGWRVPTIEELVWLRGADSEWTTKNGIYGNLFGTTPYQIFLPASGWRHAYDGSRDYVGEYGLYWSSTQYDREEFARFLFFSGNRIGEVGSWQQTGRSIRCVAIK